MVFNHTKKTWTEGRFNTRGVVYIDENYIELGYFDRSPQNIPIIFDDEILYLDSLEHCKLQLYWRNSIGCYTLNPAYSNNIIVESKHNFYYPIGKYYNFSKLNLYPKEIISITEAEFEYIKLFSFGFEHETCGGNIPWLDCLNTNFIPLYDGSIKGHEYVSFPLNSFELPSIKNHLTLLEQYTKYDKDCSLHIHIGGFPIDYKKIEQLCKYWAYFQWIISNYIPYSSYYVESYKSNGKAYNKPWPKNTTLSNYYKKFTKNDYNNNNSFYLSNKYDIDEERKWEVSGRYYNMNIMHLIAGVEHKTVEFRFLRPTTNYSEIKWYILVLGAFLNYVIRTDSNKYSCITLNQVLTSTFPKEIVTKLKVEGEKLYRLHKIQITNQDLGGLNLYLKDVYLNKLCKFVI